jgi:hypothetical protein
MALNLKVGHPLTSNAISAVSHSAFPTYCALAEFEKHTMHYLTVDNGVPVIQKVKLYRGDFVIPDRASVSIRIEGKQ